MGVVSLMAGLVACPTHIMQVQQLLCDPAQLSRFLSPAECAAVSRHFTGMYSLGKDDLVSGVRERFWK